MTRRNAQSIGAASAGCCSLLPSLPAPRYCRREVATISGRSLRLHLTKQGAATEIIQRAYLSIRRLHHQTVLPCRRKAGNASARDSAWFSDQVLRGDLGRDLTLYGTCCMRTPSGKKERLRSVSRVLHMSIAMSLVSTSRIDNQTSGSARYAIRGTRGERDDCAVLNARRKRNNAPGQFRGAEEGQLQLQTPSLAPPLVHSQ